MDIFLRRYFWAIELTIIAGGAFFSVTTAQAFIGGDIRPLPEISADIASSTTAPTPDDHLLKLQKAKDANIFGTRLETTSSMALGSKGPQGEIDPVPIPSAIKASLVGTVVAREPRWSLAVIIDGGVSGAGIYGVDATLFDKEYSIIGIERRRVLLRHGDRIEFLDLDTEKSVAMISGGRAGDPVSDPGIRKIGDATFAVSRATLDSTLANLDKTITEVKVVPNFEGGKVNGFKFSAIKQGSIFSKIGVQNGDVIQRLNGLDMNSVEKAVEALQRFKDAPNITVGISRNGKQISMEYTIR